jgi:hypothetical protein
MDNSKRKTVEYFIGKEIEHTPMLGRDTLFVVGIKSVAGTVKRAHKHKLTHIYLGTSDSFHPIGKDWLIWDEFVQGLLAEGFYVTVDMDYTLADSNIVRRWVANERFIPMIRVQIPYVQKLGTNAQITFEDAYTGRWTHSLNRLKDYKVFTSWDEYQGDTVIL